jgi:hypothetical protein
MYSLARRSLARSGPLACRFVTLLCICVALSSGRIEAYIPYVRRQSAVMCDVRPTQYMFLHTSQMDRVKSSVGAPDARGTQLY